VRGLPGFCVAMSALVLAGSVDGTDWPQWRGPDRTGLVQDSPALATAFPEGGPKVVWTSERILGDRMGGYGSTAVADGKVYVFSNWKYAVPIETRTLPANGLQRLGWVGDMPQDVFDKLEAARLSDERAALEARAVRRWANKWIGANLTKEQQKLRNACLQRLTQGADAVSAELGRKLAGIVDNEFATPDALSQWFEDNDVDVAWRKRILRVVPTKRGGAYDRIYSLDAETGERVWMTELPGVATAHPSSCTPTIVDGRCYVQGSGGSLYCLDAGTGKLIWQAKFESKSGKKFASSLAVQDGVAVLLAGRLRGYDAATGEELWTQPLVTGYYASAVSWRAGEKTYLLCNGGKQTFCVEPKTGEIVWAVTAGGDSTPAVAGDVMVVFAHKAIFAYKLSMEEPQELWRVAIQDRGASPVIYEGHVYALGGKKDGQALCVNLETGQVAWRQKLGFCEIVTPVVADGKLFSVVNTSLYMLEATPTAFKLLGRAEVKSTRCVAPALADGMLYLRLKEAVVCYDFNAAAE